MLEFARLLPQRRKNLLPMTIGIKYKYLVDFNEFRKVMDYLNEKLARWLRRKYKNLRHGYISKARYVLALTVQKIPNLFAHWACGYRLYLKNVN